MSTLSDTHSPNTLQSELAAIVNEWEKHAGKYFVLAERERDPLGQKFYQSTAVAYANCAMEVRRLFDHAPVVLRNRQAGT
jgi:hypothetical protein